MRAITWLASFPKSGNTWMRMLLAAYRFGDIHINRTHGIARLDTEAYSHTVVAPKDLGDMQPQQILYLRYAALTHLIVRHPYDPVLLKTHNANIRVGQVDLIPEDMTERAVYIVRDPRDVVVSFAEHVGHTVDDAIERMNNDGSTLDNGQLGIYHYLMTWSRHVTTWTEDAKFPVLTIRYEDLLSDPEVALFRVIQHFGEEPDLDRIKAAVEATRFDRLQEQEEQDGFSERSRKADKFFSRGTSGGWREVLKPEQVSRIESNHAEVMDKMGYLKESEKCAS